MPSIYARIVIMNKWIIAIGSLDGGLEFHGPFEDVIKADDYAKEHFPNRWGETFTYELHNKDKVVYKPKEN